MLAISKFAKSPLTIGIARAIFALATKIKSWHWDTATKTVPNLGCNEDWIQRKATKI